MNFYFGTLPVLGSPNTECVVSLALSALYCKNGTPLPFH